ncbi:MAG: transglutaminase domain-containing protein [Porticoccaceae bacterium]
MRYQVVHHTSYEYIESVSQCINLAYVMPRNTLRQTCLEARLSVSPLPVTATERSDYYGNRAYHFAIEQHHKTLEVTATSLVDVIPGDIGLELDLGNTCAQVRHGLANSGDREVLRSREFILPSPLVEVDGLLRNYGKQFFDDGKPFLSCVRALTQSIYQEFEYDPLFSDVTTPLLDVFKHKRGVCQDFAHLAIACIRANGFPARYVSGYLETLPPPGQEKLMGSDASHAWFAVYSPGEGWFEFDPTNDQMAGHQHIVTAWGRDYTDVPPLRGVIFGGGETHKLKVSVDVSRVV